jgi:hypothetical protein
MKKIKFRAKAVGNVGSWVYGYYHFDKEIGKHYICTLEKLLRVEVEAESVGQLTGLTDTNGKECYNGDIVKTDYGTALVIFHCGAFMLQWIDDKEANMELLGMNYNTGRERYFEIIGNTTNTPELLTK